MAQVKEKSPGITIWSLLPKVFFLIFDLPSIARGLCLLFFPAGKKKYTPSYFLEKNARMFPDRIAVMDFGKKLTYSQLNMETNRIAHYFKHILKRDDIVAIMIKNSAEFISVVIGLSKIGVIVAPLATSQSRRSLGSLLDQLRPKAVIVGIEFMEVMNEALKLCVNFHTDLKYFVDEAGRAASSCSNFEGFIDLYGRTVSCSPENPGFPGRGENVTDNFLYIFTSGTTGGMKASLLTYSRWLKGVSGIGLCALRLKPEDVVYICIPLYHSTAFSICFSSALVAGAGAVCAERFSARNFWREIIKYKATCFAYSGEMCTYLLSQDESKEDRAHSVRVVVGNGLRFSVWNEFKERFEIKRVAEFYASSEGNTGFANVFNVDGSVGLTVSSYAVVKYDESGWLPLKDEEGGIIRARRGETGLLLTKVTGKWHFDGYLNERDNEKILMRNVISRGDCWLNTGDLVRSMGFWHLQFVERICDSYRINGHNISADDIEDVVRSSGLVEHAAAYGIKLGVQGTHFGVVSVVPKNDSVSGIDELGEFLLKNLPLNSVPGFIRKCRFIASTDSIKINKRTLKEEGVDPKVVNDPLFYFDKRAGKYCPLTQDRYSAIYNCSN
ncbi:MAG: long-chain-acyl-CoA synthetase [Oligoflexales bacterium]|nr:long-chain-acyl-CoA synthetase [Oligoflexales bacterium]